MEVRPIDGNILRKWCEKIIDQACHPATVQIGEVFLDKVRSMPTLTLPNEWVSAENAMPAEHKSVRYHREPGRPQRGGGDRPGGLLQRVPAPGAAGARRHPQHTQAERGHVRAHLHGGQVQIGQLRGTPDTPGAAAAGHRHHGGPGHRRRDGTGNAQRLEIVKGIQTDRLRELAQADREGRCVVLPVKPDQTIYQWRKGDDCPSVSRLDGVQINADGEITYPIWNGYLIPEDFGKTVFLTREEAALQREQDGE